MEPFSFISCPRLLVGLLLLLLPPSGAQQTIFKTTSPTASPEATTAPSIATVRSTESPSAAESSAHAPSVAATSRAPVSAGDYEAFKFKVSYQLITKVTDAIPDIDAATRVVEKAFSTQIDELTRSDASGNRVVFQNVSDTKVTACASFDEDRYSLYDACHNAQSTVQLSVEPGLDVEVAKYAVMEDLQGFAERYNANQTSILILFESPLYVSTTLNIFLIMVPGAMTENEAPFFEEMLFKVLSPILVENEEVPFTLLEAKILSQSPYVPNANSTRRQLAELPQGVVSNATSGIDLGTIDPSTIPYDDVEMYLQASCAGASCTSYQLEQALYRNASQTATGLYRAIEVNRQLLSSSYFDYLASVLVVRRPELNELPQYDPQEYLGDAIPEQLSEVRIPNWVWILCGVNVGIMLVAAAWIVVQSVRRETKERENLDHFVNSCDW